MIPSLKDIAALPSDTPVLAARGTITAAGEYQTGPGAAPGEMLTLQEIGLRDASGVVLIAKVGNHPDLIKLVNTEVVLLSHRTAKGKNVGLKLVTESRPDSQPYPCLQVTKSATITPAVTFDQQQQTQQQVGAPVGAAPTQTAPVPQTPTLPQNLPQQSPPQNVPVAGGTVEVRPIEPAEPQPQLGQTIKPGGSVITTVTYGRKVYLGNFCSENMEITMELNGTSVADGVAALKFLLQKHLPPEFIPAGPRK